MAREFAKQFYKSRAWRECRAAYVASVFGMCEKCKDKPGVILHHKIELSPDNISNPNITLNHENLQFLCIEHHNTINCPDVVRDDVMFNASGQLIKR